MRKVKSLFAAAAVASLGLAGAAKADTVSFGNYSGPISIQITALDEGVLYQQSAATNAGVTGASNVDALTQSTPVGANAGEDTWGIFLVNQIFGSSNQVLYDRNTSSTILTGIIWGGQDVFVQTVGSGLEIVHTDGSQIAVFGQSAAGFNASAFGQAGPSIRDNSNLSAPSYAGVTTGTLVWTFNNVSGALEPASDDQQYSFSNGSFSNLSTASVSSGNGGFEAATGTNGWGTGVENNVFKPNTDGSAISATYGFPQDELAAGQAAGWTVGAKDPIDGTFVPVPLPTSATMGGAIIAGMLGMAIRRRRAMQD